MKLINKKLGNVAIKVPNILFPKKSVDLNKWAVIACDQYTTESEYWNQVAKNVGSSPSTLKLMLPEYYLECENENKMQKNILKEMKKYLRSKILLPLEAGFIYVERTTSYGNIRKGLLTCIDLEHYDYSSTSKSLIRPTEKTILERIPPRVKIREQALIELPHILLLIDDCDKSVIEPFSQMKNSYKKLYDFDLMQNGGHIEGYHITSLQGMEHLSKSLHDLGNEEVFKNKYNSDEVPLLFAVGDGNHSLASAKAHWENIKSDFSIIEQETHPARFALVEVVNIHDKDLLFEPIHRVLFNSSINELLQVFKEKDSTILKVDNIDKVKTLVFEKAFSPDEHCFGVISKESNYFISLTQKTSFTACGTIQNILDEFSNTSDLQIDFIHDLSSLVELAEQGHIGILLPPIDKSCFFKTVIEEGTMPRKTFSMGHADEKRFYLETRKIVL